MRIHASLATPVHVGQVLSLRHVSVCFPGVYCMACPDAVHTERFVVVEVRNKGIVLGGGGMTGCGEWLQQRGVVSRPFGPPCVRRVIHLVP